MNGDGYSDVIVGAHGYDNGEDDEGRAYVYHGSAPLPTFNCTCDNNCSSNGQTGIHLNGSSNNTIYNNYFGNTHNARDDGTNVWNITKTDGTNIVRGSYLGGNYWSDYAGNDTFVKFVIKSAEWIANDANKRIARM